MESYKKYLNEMDSFDDRETNAKEWIKQEIKQNIEDIIHKAIIRGYDSMDSEEITDQIMLVINNLIERK